MKTSWQGSAPSNIALIKYMGKKPGNIPSNPSLSYSVDHFRTHVEIRETDNPEDSWSPSKTNPLDLSEFGKNRYLNHLKLVKEYFDFKGHFELTSYNDFPSDCGLASSASSFAALTKVAFEALGELTSKEYSISDMARFSRQGSGSSCRSFYSPWALWHNEGAEPIELGYEKLIHAVAVIDSSKKKVTTSNAHQRIRSSLLDSNRPQRATMRLQQLIKSFKAGDWGQAFEICWAEFWDMHVLFETSNPCFGYMQSGSFEVLNSVRDYWRQNSDGPIVTMDAGPNVHLFFREDQLQVAKEVLADNSQFKWIAPDVL